MEDNIVPISIGCAILGGMAMHLASGSDPLAGLLGIAILFLVIGIWL